jgi:type VI secretion system protein ImpC
MSHDAARARVSLSVDPRGAGEGAVPIQVPPFCVLVLGDFSCREHAPSAPALPLAERRPVPAASVEEVLDRLRPTLEFELDGPGRVHLEVRTLEDLHPDRLAETVPHLRALVEAVGPAVSAVRRGGAAAVGPEGARAAPAPGGGAPGGAAGKGLLDEIVAAAPASGTAPPGPGDPMAELAPWIRSVVGPHLVRQETTDQEALRRRLEGEAAHQVLRVLGAPPVRALEGLLRSLLLLLSSADATTGVRVHVLDVTRAELEQDLAGELEESALMRVLLEPLPGPCGQAAPALLVGAYAFGAGAREVALLNRLAMLAHVLGAPWLADAAPDLLGGPSFEAVPDTPEPEPSSLWDAFRRTPAAAAVGLAAPPFLTRIPYGPGTDPCDLAGLDEAAPPASATGPDAGAQGPTGGAAGLPGAAPGTGRYVWGNAAFVCAAALASAFAERGWDLRADGPVELAGRPIHVTVDGRVAAHPVATAWRTGAVARVLASGVMPLVAFRGEARLRVPRIGSVSRPPAPLRAWWKG